MDKEAVVKCYTHTKILLSHKKNEILAICYKMNRPGGYMLSEICQTNTA